MDILDSTGAVRPAAAVDFTSPITLARHTGHTRYRLLRHEGRPHWMVGREDCLPGYRVRRPRGFTAWTVELVARGQGEARTREGTFTLKPGSVFSYGPGEPVSLDAGRQTMLKYFISALEERVWARSWFSHLRPGHTYEVPDSLSALPLLEGLLHSSSARETGGDAAAFAMLEGVAAWLQMSREARRGQARSPLLEAALRLLEVRYRELPSVTAWADALGVSAPHLCRVFRAQHGRTPYAELTDRKLQHAYQRLRRDHLPVQEVAREVGYEDPFHFSRLFKRRMGVPPSQVR
ncbi:MAG: AraC family transcriptional regulator [Opitutales bacterium]